MLEGMLTQKTRREERERERERRETENTQGETDILPFGSSFYLFFLPPVPALCKLS